VTALVERRLAALGVGIEVAFCPERIAEGKALTELFELPQIVSARSPGGRLARARKLFEVLASETVELLPRRRSWPSSSPRLSLPEVRLPNQLYMMARLRARLRAIRQGVTQHYPRAADLPPPVLPPAPAWLKDTMQLAAFNNNNFMLGHAP